jgi:hypothetical protein
VVVLAGHAALEHAAEHAVVACKGCAEATRDALFISSKAGFLNSGEQQGLGTGECGVAGMLFISSKAGFLNLGTLAACNKFGVVELLVVSVSPAHAAKGFMKAGMLLCVETDGCKRIQEHCTAPR